MVYSLLVKALTTNRESQTVNNNSDSEHSDPVNSNVNLSSDDQVCQDSQLSKEKCQRQERLACLKGSSLGSTGP